MPYYSKAALLFYRALPFYRQLFILVALALVPLSPLLRLMARDMGCDAEGVIDGFWSPGAFENKRRIGTGGVSCPIQCRSSVNTSPTLEFSGL